MRIYWWLLFPFLLGCRMGSEEMRLDVRPNVIIILADDQGWGDLSNSGNTDIHTPNIDRLAKEGASFDRFYVQPVCSPTRAEILTGRYHFRSGVRSTSAGGERIDLDERLISEAFQNAGYRTAAFGKWHSGSQHPYHPNSRGFSEYYGFTSGHWGHYYNPPIDHNGTMTKGNGYLPDDLTDHAIDFCSKQKDPFFVFLAFNTPHSPMQVPQRWYQKFRNKNLKGVPNDSLSQLHARAALAMVENIDFNVGRLSEHLRAYHLEENTIVLYLTDNGPNGVRWNQNMKGRKGSTDEGGVRSPLFVKWPSKIKGGIEIPQITAAIDIGPTLFEACSIPAPKIAYDGQSLLPLLLQQEKAWPDRLLLQTWRGRISIRSQNYRLDHEKKLFDMISDPGQTKAIQNEDKVNTRLMNAWEDWEPQITNALNEKDSRPFPIGHLSFNSDYLPVRDAVAHGNIQRSNRWPNDSYFTNWVNTSDSITWEIEVLEKGKYEFLVHYTCPKDQIGSTIQLSLGNQQLIYKIEEAHDPPLIGKDQDRYPRGESLVKDFKSQSIGHLDIDKGKYRLSLSATEIKATDVADISRITVNKLTQ